MLVCAAFQCAVTVGATVLTPARASASRTPPFGCRGILCRAGDLCVLRPARRIHIRLRGRVLHNSPPPASVRSALAPTVTALGTLGSSARCSGARPLSRSLRLRSRRLRGDTRRNASSLGYRLLALRRVSPRIRRTASAHVAQFGARPLAPCLTFHEARFSSQRLRSPTFRQLA